MSAIRRQVLLASEYCLKHSQREVLVPGDELTGPEKASFPEMSAAAGSSGGAAPAEPSADAAETSATAQETKPAIRRYLTAPVRLWLVIFGASLGAFLIRFLVPSPVAQADNRDGPRLMCGLGLGPVTHGHPRFFRFAYFVYVHKPACNGRAPYPSSQLVPLELARLLTPVFGLPGSLNMIALGVLMCLMASIGIASLATGLRVSLWAKLLVAAVIWVIVADSAFFDVFAGPFSEPAALVGLVLTAGGLVYLGRGWHLTLFGLVLAGGGGALAVLSKEQYLVWAAPICLALVLATATPGRWYSLSRFRSREARGGLVTAVALAALTALYLAWDSTSHYAKRLHYIQAIDMIFTDIVTKRSNAVAGLRALGLPLSWAKYAGHYYWHPDSVRTDPLLMRYVGKLSDGNLARYLLTHPAAFLRIGQNAAIQAQRVRVTALGDYAPSAGYPKGTIESRVLVFTSLMHLLPSHLGLLLYVPVWLAMVAIAFVALGWSGRRPWNRDGAVLVLCMTGCAVTGFAPPAFFAGISTTRHMVGTNLATALAFTIAVGLATSLVRQAIRRRRPQAPAESIPATPELSRSSS